MPLRKRSRRLEQRRVGHEAGARALQAGRGRRASSITQSRNGSDTTTAWSSSPSSRAASARSAGVAASTMRSTTVSGKRTWAAIHSWAGSPPADSRAQASSTMPASRAPLRGRLCLAQHGHRARLPAPMPVAQLRPTGVRGAGAEVGGQLVARAGTRARVIVRLTTCTAGSARRATTRSGTRTRRAPRAPARRRAAGPPPYRARDGLEAVLGHELVDALREGAAPPWLRPRLGLERVRRVGGLVGGGTRRSRSGRSPPPGGGRAPGRRTMAVEAGAAERGPAGRAHLVAPTSGSPDSVGVTISSCPGSNSPRSMSLVSAESEERHQRDERGEHHPRGDEPRLAVERAEQRGRER